LFQERAVTLTARERVEALRTIVLDEIDRRRSALFTNGAGGIDNPVRLQTNVET